MRSKLEGSCKNCKDRHIGCHSECEKYAEFKQDIEDLKEKIRNESYSEKNMTSRHMRVRSKSPKIK